MNTIRHDNRFIGYYGFDYIGQGFFGYAYIEVA